MNDPIVKIVNNDPDYLKALEFFAKNKPLSPMTNLSQSVPASNSNQATKQ